MKNNIEIVFKNKETRRINVCISKNAKIKLKAICEAKGITLAEAIEEAISIYIQRNEDILDEVFK